MTDRPTYKVGQVLYVILSDKALVVPVCVLEKRTSETTEGVATTYIVKSPKPDAPSYDLATVKGTVYSSIDDVKSTMVQNARRAIEEMVTRAESASQKAFGQPRLPPPAARQAQDDPFGVDPLGESMSQLTPVPRPTNGAVPSSEEGRVVEVPQADGTVKRVMLT